VSEKDPQASAAGRALRSLRKTHEGRPAVFHKCPHCDSAFRAKDIRHHKARCEKNPTMIRRIREELKK
jgi:acetyl-CoA carboxylase beta subunit